MQVIPSNDDCPLHLQLLYNSSEDTATNVYSTGKGAFFVDVCSFNGLSSNQAWEDTVRWWIPQEHYSSHSDLPLNPDYSPKNYQTAKRTFKTRLLLEVSWNRGRHSYNNGVFWAWRLAISSCSRRPWAVSGKLSQPAKTFIRTAGYLAYIVQDSGWFKKLQNLGL